jgi:hypothetical protein
MRNLVQACFSDEDRRTAGNRRRDMEHEFCRPRPADFQGAFQPSGVTHVSASTALAGWSEVAGSGGVYQSCAP